MSVANQQQTSPIEASKFYVVMARAEGVRGVYELAVGNGESATVLLYLVREFRAMSPRVAFPRSRRREPWALTRPQRHALIDQANGEGVLPSATAAALKCGVATVRRRGRLSKTETERMMLEILERAVPPDVVQATAEISFQKKPKGRFVRWMKVYFIGRG